MVPWVPITPTSTIQTVSRSVQPFQHVTNRQTDEPRYSGSNRPHLMLRMAMRQNNVIKLEVDGKPVGECLPPCYTCTHAQTDGQSEIIMPPPRRIRWAAGAQRCGSSVATGVPSPSCWEWPSLLFRARPKWPKSEAQRAEIRRMQEHGSLGKG